MPSLPTRNSKRALSRKKASRSSSGFTLIETIAALTILAVGVLGVAAGLLTAMKVSSQSREKTEAIFLAEQQLEIFRIMPASEVAKLAAGGNAVNDTDNPINPNDDSSTEYLRSWVIENDTPEEDVISIAVTVSWTDTKGVGRSTVIQTLKAGS